MNTTEIANEYHKLNEYLLEKHHVQLRCGGMADSMGYLMNGFKNNNVASSISDFGNVFNAMKQIPILFKPRKTIYKFSTSYGFKHQLEDYRCKNTPEMNIYISNGEFILAMILLGYKYKVSDSVNIYFHCQPTLKDSY